jgi:hypothetical protein
MLLSRLVRFPFWKGRLRVGWSQIAVIRLHVEEAARSGMRRPSSAAVACLAFPVGVHSDYR